MPCKGIEMSERMIKAFSISQKAIILTLNWTQAATAVPLTRSGRPSLPRQARLQAFHQLATCHRSLSKEPHSCEYRRCD